MSLDGASGEGKSRRRLLWRTGAPQGFFTLDKRVRNFNEFDVTLSAPQADGRPRD
jgi:hypothetical protein